MPEVARRAYYAQSPWKRIVVILAAVELWKEHHAPPQVSA